MRVRGSRTAGSTKSIVSPLNQQVACDIVLFKTHHYIIFFVRPPHSNISREWRVIVDLVQTDYHGRPIVLLSVRCDRAVDYDGSSLWSDVF